MSDTTKQKVNKLKSSKWFKRFVNAMHEHGIEVAITGVTATGVVLLLWGSALVVNATILAVTTTVGFVLLASKLPRPIQKTLVKYGFITDFVAAYGTYCILGGTATALLAASMVGIFTSLLIWALKPLILEDDLVDEVTIEQVVI